MKIAKLAVGMVVMVAESGRRIDRYRPQAATVVGFGRRRNESSESVAVRFDVVRGKGAERCHSAIYGWARPSCIVGTVEEFAWQDNAEFDSKRERSAKAEAYLAASAADVAARKRVASALDALAWAARDFQKSEQLSHQWVDDASRSADRDRRIAALSARAIEYGEALEAQFATCVALADADYADHRAAEFAR